MLLGNDEINSPENNFELLWSDFNEHYALFGVKNINWQDVYNTYRPQVNPNTTNTELWEITTNMLEVLNDGHTTLINPKNNWFFESGDSLNVQALSEFDLQLVKNNYLDYLSYSSEPDISFGKLKNKDIGYIHLYSVEGDKPEVIDDIIQHLKHHKAIVVDIRNNGGGYDNYASRIAGAFADGEHFIYTVQTKNGPEPNDFDEKKKYYTKPKGAEQFLKPVILLTDRFTASGAEIFTLNMRAFNHVTIVGDITAGDHSDQSNLRFLPNGWVYTYSPQLYLMPNGESLEGIGISPDVYIKNTEYSINNEIDLVIEEAIDYLFVEHDIE
jgi:C-terminal processing protease CtpA/Prc